MSNRVWLVQYKQQPSAGVVVLLAIMGFFVWMFEIAVISFIMLGWLVLIDGSWTTISG